MGYGWFTHFLRKWPSPSEFWREIQISSTPSHKYWLVPYRPLAEFFDHEILVSCSQLRMHDIFVGWRRHVAVASFLNEVPMYWQGAGVNQTYETVLWWLKEPRIQCKSLIMLIIILISQHFFEVIISYQKWANGQKLWSNMNQWLIYTKIWCSHIHKTPKLSLTPLSSNCVCCVWRIEFLSRLCSAHIEVW